MKCYIDYKGWGLSHGNCMLDHEEIWKWKWMVLGALGCMNNAGFERKKNW